MLPGLIARKVGMSRIFLPTGEAVPVTYLKIEENQVVRTKTEEKDGYNAVVVGVGKSVKKTKNGKENAKFAKQKEFQVESIDDIDAKATATAELLPADSIVTISGISKGKGFQGVMKRHNFAGGPATHGSHLHRRPGSIGMNSSPSRVMKGKRMAGRMGNDQVTLKNRSVVATDTKEGLIAIKGPIPGPTGGFVYISIQSVPDNA